MSKTIEIIHNDSRFDDDQYTIVSPDHTSDEDAGGFTLPEDYASLTEDGMTKVDIPHDKYYHLNRPHTNHVKITVEDEPQHTELELSIPYRESYTFSELVSELGVPDTDEAYNALRHQPQVSVNAVYEGGKVSIESVEVDGETFTRNS